MKSIINVGADVHKDSFSLCAVNPATGKIIDERVTNSDAKAIKRFIESVVSNHPDPAVVNSLSARNRLPGIFSGEITD